VPHEVTKIDWSHPMANRWLMALFTLTKRKGKKKAKMAFDLELTTLWVFPIATRGTGGPTPGDASQVVKDLLHLYTRET